MHRRETYVAGNLPQRHRLRRRIVTAGASLGVAVTLVGGSSVLAIAHDAPQTRPSSSAAWRPRHALPDPPVQVDQHTPVTNHGFGWPFRKPRLGVPPTALPTPTSSATDAATAKATASASAQKVASPSAAPAAVLPAQVAAGSAQRLFSSASPWNTAIASNAASDPDSGQIVSNVLDNRSLVMNLNMYAYGIPFYTATASTPRVQLGGNNPVGAVPIEPSWTPNDGGDHKMNVIDPTTSTVYELQGYDPGAHSVYWAVKKNYVTSLADGYPEDGGQAGPTGSGLTQAGGVIRLSEMASGDIDHALSFITSRPVSGFRYPASHSDGSGGGAGLQEGMRIQLDPTLDVDAIPGITPGEKAIAKALQRFGAYCTDSGGGNNQAMGFYVEKPKSGDTDPYPAAGFPQDWAQLPHIPRDRLRVLAASATPRPN